MILRSEQAKWMEETLPASLPERCDDMTRDEYLRRVRSSLIIPNICIGQGEDLYREDVDQFLSESLDAFRAGDGGLARMWLAMANAAARD